jgi:hypothetical protein
MYGARLMPQLEDNHIYSTKGRLSNYAFTRPGGILYSGIKPNPHTRGYSMGLGYKTNTIRRMHR